MSLPYSFNFAELEERIIHCRKCPRLVHFREKVAPRKAFEKEIYWRRPVPGFGSTHAKLLILGLAPAAQGGNRTGRIFTGDESAKFLMRALFEAGFASQPTSESKKDGLQLIDCYMTAACKCVPPHNRPTAKEFANCAPYFENEFLLLRHTKMVLALGRDAYETYLRFLKKASKMTCRMPPFSHGVKVVFPGWPTLFGSYHPSPQNTYTKRLTLPMLVDLLEEIKKEK